jgi:hypothetical protein
LHNGLGSLQGMAKSSFNQTTFRPAILLKPPCVLLSKPWSILWSTLNVLNSKQLLSMQ